MIKSKRNVSLAVHILLLCLSFYSVYRGYSYFFHALYPLKYEAYVEKAAQKYDVDEALVFAVIHTESHFDEDARSHAGALGLMQIMPATYEWLQTHIPNAENLSGELSEPETNIEYGVYMLSILLEKYKDETTAIYAYNAGMGNVDKWLADRELSPDGISLKTVPYTETANYAEKVCAAKKMYKKLYY